MNRFATLSLIFILFASASSAEEKPRVLNGALQEGGHLVAAELGEDGAWLVQSQRRWEELLKQLAGLKVKVDDQLGAIDFAKENLVCVFHYGDVGDQFSLRKLGGDETSREVEVALSYIIYKGQRLLPLGVWKIFVAPVPKAAATKLSVLTFHPFNGGPNPTVDKARLEWEWNFSDQNGEAIGGLTATIEPRHATIKPGEDIQIKFILSLAEAVKGRNGHFSDPREAIYVWDGKYSNGYRNHGFLVQTPDGKVTELRPKVINAWDKNIPHPIEIKAGKAYVLPNWAEGDVSKSLKVLGLDTTVPGVYVITGTYQERAEPIGERNPGMWGGMLRSNTVRVEVKN